MEYTHKKLTLIISIILSVSLVCILAYHSTKDFEKTVVSNTQQNLLTIARTQAMYIEHTIKHVQQEMKTLATESDVQNLILSGKENYGKCSSHEQATYERFQFLDLKVESTYRLDSYGIIQNRIPFKPDRPGMDFSEKPGVKDVLETHKPYVSEVLASVAGVKSISVCQPVFKDNKFIGIVRSLIFLDNIQNLAMNIRKGQKGYINIIDNDGSLIVYPQLELLGQNLVETRKKQYPSYDWSDLENIVARMTKGYEGVGSYQSVWLYEKNTSQARFLIAFTPIHIGNELWSLGVTSPYDEVSGPIKAYSQKLFIGAAMLVFSIILAGFQLLKLKKRENYLAIQAQSAEHLKQVNETLSLTNQQLQAEVADRKRTERALSKSIEKFSRVIHGTSDGFWDWDLVTNKVYLSPKYKELLGYEDYELESSYQTWESRIHSDDHGKVMRSYQEHLENCVPINIDYRLRTKNGDYRWFNARGQATWDDEGKPIRISGSIRDITDIKTTQEKLEGSEKFLSNVFSSIQDGISILDKDMNIVKVNPTVERWHPHMMPLVGKKCYETYHGRDEFCDICPVRQTFQTGMPAYEIVPKTGPAKKTVGWLELYSFPIFDEITGQIQGAIEYARDISARKQAEDQLKQTKDHFHYLLKSTPVVIYSAEPSKNHAVTFMSENVTDRFGYTPEDFMNDSNFRLNHIHPEDREKVLAEFPDDVSSKDTFSCEYRFLHKDGSYRWVHDAANAARDADGKCTEIVGYILDLTERKKAAKQESVIS